MSLNSCSLTPNKPTPIHCVIRYNNLSPIVISSVEKVEPRYWNAEKQSARANQRNEKGDYINEILTSIKEDCENVFDEYKKVNKAYPARDHYKQLCLKAINKQEQAEQANKALDLLGYVAQFIKDCETGSRLNHRTGKPLSKETIQIYKNAETSLDEFSAAKNYKLNFENITLDFYAEYTEYLKFIKKYQTNTIGKYIKTIKTFLTEAKENGVNTTEHFKSKRFQVITEDTDSIYLNTQELNQLFELDLSGNKRLERVRDLFLIGCWTGLRFSDYNDISHKNIQGDFLKITTAKRTGKRSVEVVIPIHATVKAIMERYKDQTENSLPPSISNTKLNAYIKEVAEEAKINELIESTFTKAGMLVVKTGPKYDYVSSHTARRSFATNMYLMGVPTLTIMAITGHKTEKSFMRYIKVTPEEHAKNMLSIWNRQTMKAVNV